MALVTLQDAKTPYHPTGPVLRTSSDALSGLVG